MQRNLRKLGSVIASSILITNFIQADVNEQIVDDNNSVVDVRNPSIPTNTENRIVYIEKRSNANGMVNPPAMPLTRNDWDLQISADALFWQLQEDGLIYAIETTNLTLPVQVDRVKQKYNWGFRAGLNWTIPHDNWDIAATWTHLITNRHGNSTVTPGNILIKPDLVLSSPAVGFTTARAKYHNRLDQICLNIGREFFISKWVTLRPFFGLRNDWLRQRSRAFYSGATSAPTDIQQSQRRVHWWGIGIESGLNTQWSFCGGFSIYGNAATAIQYGLQELQVRESGIIADSFNDSYHVCRPTIDLQLGLGWDYNFCDDGLHFGLKLGWENHVYFNQAYSILGRTPLLQGNLTYQGWTLHANLDF